MRGKRGRVRAARTVRGAHVVPLYRDLDVAVAVEEMVDGLVAVPARDDHRRSSELMDPLRKLTARARKARESLRLAEVRRHDGRERKERTYLRLDGVVLQELRSRARDHHGIDDERDAVVLQIVRDRLD